MKVLHLVASPRFDGSTTLGISRELLAAMRARIPDLEVETIDLFLTDLPALAGDNIEAKYTLLAGMPIGREHAESWMQIEREIERFRSADAYVVTAPMWNFGIPYALKYYIDCIVQPGYLFRFDGHGIPRPLLSGKRMVVVTSSGSDYSDSSPLRPFDHFEPYLRAIFGFVGITDVSFVRAHGVDIAPGVRASSIEHAVEEARDYAAMEASIAGVA